MSQNFDFRFFPKKQHNHSVGKVKLYIRITVDGRRVETATGCVVDPLLWNSITQRLNGKTEGIRETNRYIDGLQSKLVGCHGSLIRDGAHVSAEVLRNHFAGKNESEYGIVQVIKAHHENIKQLIGVDFEASTVKDSRHHKPFTIFIKWKYDLSEVLVKQLTFAFMADFEFYLKIQARNGNNTIEKHVQNIKRVVSAMVKRGALKTDPFADFKVKRIVVARRFLSEEELEAMMKKDFAIERVAQVRDIFIFSCYTGLSYIDILNLKPHNLVTGIDCGKWIFTVRQKMGTKSNVPLLDPALAIIKKYRAHPAMVNNNKLLPVISNQKMNAYLKEVAELCGINKELTFHCARHTFATTASFVQRCPD